MENTITVDESYTIDVIEEDYNEEIPVSIKQELDIEQEELIIKSEPDSEPPYCELVVVPKTENPYQCDKCPYNVGNSAEMATHQKTFHLIDLPNQFCQLCGFSSDEWDRLVLHRKQVHRIHMFQCTHCERSFYNENHWKDHLRTDHFIKWDNLVLLGCPHCSYGTKCESAYLEHNQIAHRVTNLSKSVKLVDKAVQVGVEVKKSEIPKSRSFTIVKFHSRKKLNPMGISDVSKKTNKKEKTSVKLAEKSQIHESNLFNLKNQRKLQEKLQEMSEFLKKNGTSLNTQEDTIIGKENNNNDTLVENGRETCLQPKNTKIQGLTMVDIHPLPTTGILKDEPKSPLPQKKLKEICAFLKKNGTSLNKEDAILDLSMKEDNKNERLDKTIVKLAGKITQTCLESKKNEIQVKILPIIPIVPKELENPPNQEESKEKLTENGINLIKNVEKISEENPELLMKNGIKNTKRTIIPDTKNKIEKLEKIIVKLAEKTVELKKSDNVAPQEKFLPEEIIINIENSAEIDVESKKTKVPKLFELCLTAMSFNFGKKLHENTISKNISQEPRVKILQDIQLSKNNRIILNKEEEITEDTKIEKLQETVVESEENEIPKLKSVTMVDVSQNILKNDISKLENPENVQILKEILPQDNGEKTKDTKIEKLQETVLQIEENEITKLKSVTENPEYVQILEEIVPQDNGETTEDTKIVKLQETVLQSEENEIPKPKSVTMVDVSQSTLNKNEISNLVNPGNVQILEEISHESSKEKEIVPQDNKDKTEDTKIVKLEETVLQSVENEIPKLKSVTENPENVQILEEISLKTNKEKEIVPQDNGEKTKDTRIEKLQETVLQSEETEIPKLKTDTIVDISQNTLNKNDNSNLENPENVQILEEILPQDNGEKTKDTKIEKLQESVLQREENEIPKLKSVTENPENVQILEEISHDSNNEKEIVPQDNGEKTKNTKIEKLQETVLKSEENEIPKLKTDTIVDISQNTLNKSVNSNLENPKNVQILEEIVKEKEILPQDNGEKTKDARIEKLQETVQQNEENEIPKLKSDTIVDISQNTLNKNNISNLENPDNVQIPAETPNKSNKEEEMIPTKIEKPQETVQQSKKQKIPKLNNLTMLKISQNTLKNTVISNLQKPENLHIPNEINKEDTIEEALKLEAKKLISLCYIKIERMDLENEQNKHITKRRKSSPQDKYPKVSLHKVPFLENIEKSKMEIKDTNEKITIINNKKLEEETLKISENSVIQINTDEKELLEKMNETIIEENPITEITKIPIIEEFIKNPISANEETIFTNHSVLIPETPTKNISIPKKKPNFKELKRINNIQIKSINKENRIIKPENKTTQKRKLKKTLQLNKENSELKSESLTKTPKKNITKKELTTIKNENKRLRNRDRRQHRKKLKMLQKIEQKINIKPIPRLDQNTKMVPIYSPATSTYKWVPMNFEELRKLRPLHHPTNKKFILKVNIPGRVVSIKIPKDPPEYKKKML